MKDMCAAIVRGYGKPILQEAQRRYYKEQRADATSEAINTFTLFERGLTMDVCYFYRNGTEMGKDRTDPVGAEPGRRR